MSKCEIKVFYVGENRNGSYIKKEVATDMAKTLRGAPIVGYYKQEKEDFADHGEKVIIDDDADEFLKYNSDSDENLFLYHDIDEIDKYTNRFRRK